MRTSQIILLFITIFLIVGMFVLPTVVVSNQENNLKTEEKTSEKAPLLPDAHQQSLSKELESELTRLKKLLENEENTQKVINFADSIALLYKQVSKYDSAAKYAEYAALKKPTDAQAISQAADGYFEAFNFYGIIDQNKAQKYGSIAQKYLEQLLANNPKDYQAKTKLAITQVASSNPMRGIIALKEVIEEDPKNELALLNLGLFSMQSGQYEKAVDRFKALTDINPKNAEAKIFLGQCYANMGKQQEAKAIFEEIIQQSSDSLLKVAAKEYLLQLK